MNIHSFFFFIFWRTFSSRQINERWSTRCCIICHGPERFLCLCQNESCDFLFFLEWNPSQSSLATTHLQNFVPVQQWRVFVVASFQLPIRIECKQLWCFIYSSHMLINLVVSIRFHVNPTIISLTFVYTIKLNVSNKSQWIKFQVCDASAVEKQNNGNNVCS